jgi:serine/threonine protein kinase
MPASSLVGSKIGNYELLEFLGEGTSTYSFLARDDRGKLLVAKRLADPLAADRATAARFLAVSELSSKIRMKRCVAVVVAQRSSADGVFLFREHVEGRPLSRIVEAGRLSELDPGRVADDLCEAVRALASRGVIHGGIHPGNVIVQADGQARVTDFGVGLSRLTSKAGDSYPLDALRYLAPEQLRGESAEAQADVYAVGLLVSLLYHGVPPFAAADRRELATRILTGFAEANPVLAAAVDRFAAKRYGSVDALRDRLKDLFPPEAKPDDKVDHKPDKRPDPRPEVKLDLKPEPKLESKPEPKLEPKPEPKSEPERQLQPKTAEPPGELSRIFDLKGGRDLLTLPANEPWRVPRAAAEQRPLQLVNQGRGPLRIAIKCVGRGVSANLAEVDIRPGGMAPLIVTFSADGDEWANLQLTWQNGSRQANRVMRIQRTV